MKQTSAVPPADLLQQSARRRKESADAFERERVALYGEEWRVWVIASIDDMKQRGLIS